MLKHGKKRGRWCELLLFLPMYSIKASSLHLSYGRKPNWTTYPNSLQKKSTDQKIKFKKNKNNWQQGFPAGHLLFWARLRLCNKFSLPVPRDKCSFFVAIFRSTTLHDQCSKIEIKHYGPERSTVSISIMSQYYKVYSKSTSNWNVI